MTYTQVAQMIGGIGYPFAYYQFPEDTGQEPPFICFYYPQNNDMYADDQNYQKIEHLIIELYTDTKDFEAEAAVETALKANGFSWSRSETWIDAERMHEVIYETDVVVTEETNNAHSE